MVGEIMRLSSLLVLRSFSSCRMPHFGLLTSKLKANPEMDIEIGETMSFQNLKNRFTADDNIKKNQPSIKMAPWKWLRVQPNLLSVFIIWWNCPVRRQQVRHNMTRTHQGDPLWCPHRRGLHPWQPDRAAPQPHCIPGRRQCKFSPKR